MASLPLWVAAAVLLVAGGATWAAGTSLTRHVDGLANQTGASRALLGALLLGGITSLPEAVTMTTAAAVGGGALALGNVVGSTSANLAILAGADLAVPGVAIVHQAEAARVQRPASLLVVLLAVAGCAAVLGPPVEIEVDVWSVVIALGAVACFVLIHRGSGDVVVDDPEADLEELDRGQRIRRLVGAGAVIVVAGYGTASAGSAIAERTGLSGSFVGFALLAAATSLPELSTTLAAVRLGRAGLAFGNILGTNIFNQLLILPADIVDGRGPIFGSSDDSIVFGAFLGIILVGVYLTRLDRPSAVIAGRVGIESVVILAVYAGGMAVLYGLG